MNWASPDHGGGRASRPRLVMTCMDHARRLECTEIWVVADPTDEAEGFWQSLRWHRTGERLAMFSAGLG